MFRASLGHLRLGLIEGDCHHFLLFESEILSTPAQPSVKYQSRRMFCTSQLSDQRILCRCFLDAIPRSATVDLATQLSINWRKPTNQQPGEGAYWMDHPVRYCISNRSKSEFRRSGARIFVQGSLSNVILRKCSNCLLGKSNHCR